MRRIKRFEYDRNGEELFLYELKGNKLINCYVMSCSDLRKLQKGWNKPMVVKSKDYCTGMIKMGERFFHLILGLYLHLSLIHI